MASSFKTGDGVVLQSAMTTPSDSFYLEASSSAEKSVSVYLSNSEVFPGCYWSVFTSSSGTIRFRTVSTGSDRRYLDSSGAAHKDNSVYLADNSAGGGSQWLPTLLPDGCYTFKSNTPSGSNRYMYGDPTSSKEDQVYLVETGDSPNAHWRILLTHYTGESVQSIISAAYPSVPISSYETNSKYGSLDYDRLLSIWKDTQLGDNQITPNAGDFAVCLKAEVHKQSYNSDSPLPDDKGSLCGIMWGSIGGKTRALNFIIDPFQNILLFDPQNGQKITNNEFTPTFCMV